MGVIGVYFWGIGRLLAFMRCGLDGMQLGNELRVGFENTGLVVAREIGGEQSHRYTVVVVGLMLHHSTKTVGLLERQGFCAGGDKADA